MKFQKILKVDSNNIELLCLFKGLDLWPKIEAIAQCMGLHLRYVLDFKMHLFLVKIKKLSFLKEINKNQGIVKAKLIAQGGGGYLYKGSLQDESNRETLMQGEFILGHIEYDDRFKKDFIVYHFKGLFECLMNTKRD